MASAETLLDLVPRRVTYLRGKKSDAQRAYDAYLQHRRGLTSTGARATYDQQAGPTIAPYMRDLRTAIDRMDEIARTYSSSRAGITGSNRTQLDQSVNTGTALARDARALFERWRVQPAFRYDRLNSSWVTRAFGQIFSSGEDVVQRASEKVDQETAPYRRAGAATAGAIERAAGGKGAGQAPPEGDGGGGGQDSGWSWVFGGIAVTAVLATGAAIFFGVQDRGRIAARKRTGKKLETHRDSLRKGK